MKTVIKKKITTKTVVKKEALCCAKTSKTTPGCHD